MVRREALDESRLAMDLLGERSCDDDRDLEEEDGGIGHGHPGRIYDPSPEDIFVRWFGLEDSLTSYGIAYGPAWLDEAVRRSTRGGSSGWEAAFPSWSSGGTYQRAKPNHGIRQLIKSGRPLQGECHRRPRARPGAAATQLSDTPDRRAPNPSTLACVAADPDPEGRPQRPSRLRALLLHAHSCLDAAATSMAPDDGSFDEVLAARLMIATAIALVGVDAGLDVY